MNSIKNKHYPHVKKYSLSAITNSACVASKIRQITKNLPKPCFKRVFSMTYISVRIKKRLMTPDTPRNTHLSHSRGTTLSTVVMIKIVNE